MQRFRSRVSALRTLLAASARRSLATALSLATPLALATPPVLATHAARAAETNGAVGASTTAPIVSAATSPWSLARDADGIAVYTRPVEGSGIREFKGSALVSAPAEAIRALLRDADRFKDWFPNTSESKLLAREGAVAYQYSVLDAPWPVSDRDNVFRSETRIDPATGAISIRVTAAPDYHPEQPERVRVRRALGEWRLEPVAPAETRVTFQMHLEPGGGVPQWLINAQVVDTPFEALTNLRAAVGKR